MAQLVTLVLHFYRLGYNNFSFLEIHYTIQLWISTKEKIIWITLSMCILNNEKQAYTITH